MIEEGPLRIHVTPIDDLMPHTEGADCACLPTVEVFAEGEVIIHNSFDGRELTEKELRAPVPGGRW